MDFNHTKISLRRPLGSYSKVQALYSRLVRNKKRQLRGLKSIGKKYLNVGCGENARKNFINLDYLWRPGVDLCWDITSGIPLDNSSLEGIYTEHCLEHISFSSCQKTINEFYRVLKANGIVRIIVPDAELYISLYSRARSGENVEFPYVSESDIENGFSPIMAVNRVFREHGHLFAYDFDCLSMMLYEAGFSGVSRKSFMQGKNTDLIIDSDSRKVESLYIEAVKTA